MGSPSARWMQMVLQVAQKTRNPTKVPGNCHPQSVSRSLKAQTGTTVRRFEAATMEGRARPQSRTGKSSLKQAAPPLLGTRVRHSIPWSLLAAKTDRIDAYVLAELAPRPGAGHRAAHTGGARRARAGSFASALCVTAPPSRRASTRASSPAAIPAGRRPPRHSAGRSARLVRAAQRLARDHTGQPATDRASRLRDERLRDRRDRALRLAREAHRIPRPLSQHLPAGRHGPTVGRSSMTVLSTCTGPQSRQPFAPHATSPTRPATSRPTSASAGSAAPASMAPASSPKRSGRCSPAPRGVLRRVPYALWSRRRPSTEMGHLRELPSDLILPTRRR